MSNAAKFGQTVAVHLGHGEKPALGFITHVHPDTDDGLPSVDAIVFPHGSNYPQTVHTVPLYDSVEDITDAQDDDPLKDAPRVTAFWPADDTNATVKPVKRTAAKKAAPKTDD